MRSWSYNEYTPDGGIIVTKTEAELGIEYCPTGINGCVTGLVNTMLT